MNNDGLIWAWKGEEIQGGFWQLKQICDAKYVLGSMLNMGIFKERCVLIVYLISLRCSLTILILSNEPFKACANECIKMFIKLVTRLTRLG